MENIENLIKRCDNCKLKECINCKISWTQVQAIKKIYNMFKNVNTKITKEEMHRLKKALKEDKEQKLKDWAYGLGLQLDNNIARQYKKYYEEKLREERVWAIECMETVLIYTLHFNDKCKFGGKRIEDFMQDFRVSFELISKGEYKIEDYIEQLKKDNIEIELKN